MKNNLSQNSVIAEILRRGAKPLGAYAASELLERAPEAATGFGPDPHAGWQSILSGRVEELAAAVGFNQPALFAAQLRWTKAVLSARDIPLEHVRHALEHLGHVIGEELPEELRPTALDYFERAMAEFNRGGDDVTTSLLPNTADGKLAAAYLLAVLEGDRPKASRLVLDAAARHDVRRLYLDVLLPAQAEVGRMWAAGEINVAEEHFASTTTKTVMAQLLERAPRAPHNGKTFLAAAVVGNYHDVGLIAVADFFEMAGWRAIPLGANMPVDDLVQAVEFFQADVLGLSASLSTQLPALRETLVAVRRAPTGANLKILVGGRALNSTGDLSDQIGADGYAAAPDEAVELACRLVGL